jgi:heme exporter protein A
MTAAGDTEVSQLPAGPGLEAHGLACRRGDRQLFSGLSFALPPGEALHVEGHNGSGKTSLLRMLCGLNRPSAGEIRWGGQAIGDLGDAFHAELLYIGHHNGIKDELTGLENLALADRLRGGSGSEDACLDALARMGLAGLQELPAAMLSQGQRRRLALSRLLLSRAPLWILDEPFTALDHKAVAQVRITIEQHLAKGGIVVMVTHQDVPVAAPLRRVRVGAG